MIVEKTVIKDTYLIEFPSFKDDRGYFTRAFCSREFASAGIENQWVQSNMAGSRFRGTLRGLHYQISPYAEDKLVRCVKGEVYDVVVDIRKGSKTYGSWFGVRLSAENQRMIFVPKGCAHGYMTLVDDSELYYLVSEFYTPDAERGIRWNDTAFGIEWPLTNNLILSDKDENWPDYKL